MLKNKLLWLLITILCSLTVACKRNYVDKDLSTFDFTLEQWLQQAKQQQGEQSFTFPLPEKLDVTRHGGTKEKSQFVYKYYQDSSQQNNPAAAHIGISGVVQGDKVGMLVFYSLNPEDVVKDAPNSIQNLYALFYSILPAEIDKTNLKQDILNMLRAAKNTTFLTFSQKFADGVSANAKYGQMKLQDPNKDEADTLDSLVVSICRGEDCH